MIYGAYGYTGVLCAELALERGLRPILAGRCDEPLAKLARRLDVEHVVFSLDGDFGSYLSNVDVVLHCAGPFEQTSRPMVDACLMTGTHYLDVTGEIVVFEACAKRDAEAKEAGVLVMPGVGFDVVPSDSLLAHAKRRLPSASKLRLGVLGLGQVSHGTATTVVANLHRGGLVRKGGELVSVPSAYKTRQIDFGFGRGPSFTTCSPWGDVSTAYYTTGVGDIEVYMAIPKPAAMALKANRFFGGLLTSAPVRKFLQSRVDAAPAGPTAEKRARGSSHLWAEASDDSGGRVVSRLHGPDGYDFTTQTSLMIAEKVLGGEAKAGFFTPAGLFGPDMVLDIPKVEREDAV